MSRDPRIDGYHWSGGREAMLRFGPEDGPIVVVAPPLFEEANRTRALVASMLRRLAALGIGSVLPDLPGQGESLTPTVNARLEDWQDAFAAASAAAGGRHVVALRGGCLVTARGRAVGRYLISPVPGRALVRDLLRARRAALIAAGEKPQADDLDADGPPLLLAGNLLDRDLLRALMTAEPVPADRIVRLFPDAGVADRHLAPAAGPHHDGDLPRFRAPWTAVEPRDEPGLAALLADDVAAWVARCGA